MLKLLPQIYLLICGVKYNCAYSTLEYNYVLRTQEYFGKTTNFQHLLDYYNVYEKKTKIGSEGSSADITTKRSLLYRAWSYNTNHIEFQFY